MGRIKELFQELQYQHMPDNIEYELAESYHYWEEATNFKTQILNDQMDWKEATLDLRQYTGVAPSEEPNICVLLHGGNSIIINSPFNTVYELWKKVR